MSANSHDAPETGRVRPDALEQFAADILIAAGMSDLEARVVARAMVEADLTGADAHGTFRLPQYVGWLASGEVNPQGRISVEYRAKAVALIDGGGGMGHLAMSRAVEVADKLASENGVAWVGIRRSNHAGAIGVYMERLASAGKIGICSAVSSINHMAPSGSAEALLGTNPLAIAIPAGKKAPIVVDIATSVASFGKIKAAAAEGGSIPEGWAIERSTGKPLTDPRRIDQGLLSALGDYKGSGLAIALGMLAGVLNGAAFGREIPDFAAPSASSQVNVGQFVLALSVDVFRPLAEFADAVDGHIGSLESSRLLPDQERVRLPGQERAFRRGERQRDGIPISSTKLLALDNLAMKFQVTPCYRK